MANDMILSLLLIIGIFINKISAQDFCNMPSCKERRSHTMCKYTSNGYAQKCGQPVSQGLSDEDKAAILDAHNNYRELVASGQVERGLTGEKQPAATNLGLLKWDDEVAEIAQRWASQCNFKHDKCRDIDRFGVGQNIASSSASNEYPSNYAGLVDMWYNEIDKFDPSWVAAYPYDHSEVYHYTQMMWADTTFLGCGGMKYKDDNWWTIYLVCNYGPSGNYQGSSVYQTA